MFERMIAKNELLFELCAELGQASSCQCTQVYKIASFEPAPVSVSVKCNVLSTVQIMRILFPNLINFRGDCFN